MTFLTAMNSVAAVVFGLLMSTVLLCVHFDRRKKRPRAGKVPVTVIVPCYNDEDTVADALRSIFATYPRELLDVIAVNDCSTDHGLERIEEVAREFPLRILDNKSNMGKAAALNMAMQHARHSLVLCLDADTMLNREALDDLLSRFAHDPRVGAVSCPYSPLNRGFLPSMQAIEYNMMRLGQAAANITSAMALWGGCLMVRREAFEVAGRFSLNAITEDVDLAFKMNRVGWRVEQSLVFVLSHVPATWRKWFRQKTRWTAGGFQCILKYPDVWIRNPLQMLFVCSYSFLTISALCGLTADTSVFNMGRHVADLFASGLSADTVWAMVDPSYGRLLVVKVAVGSSFSLLSVIYVLPMISRVQDWIRLTLIIPFSFGYYPLYLLVSFLGFAFWFLALRRMHEGQRAW